VPQHNAPGGHDVEASQGTSWHVPYEQYGSGPGQNNPQAPQFVGSLPVYTQVDPQHVKGTAQVVGSQPGAPPLPAVPPEPPLQFHTLSLPQLQETPLDVAQPVPG